MNLSLSQYSNKLKKFKINYMKNRMLNLKIPNGNNNIQVKLYENKYKLNVDY